MTSLNSTYTEEWREGFTLTPELRLLRIPKDNYPNLDKDEKKLLIKFYDPREMKKWDATTKSYIKMHSILDLGIEEEKLKELANHCMFAESMENLAIAHVRDFEGNEYSSGIHAFELSIEQVEGIASVLRNLYRLTEEIEELEDRIYHIAWHVDHIIQEVAQRVHGTFMIKGCLYLFNVEDHYGEELSDYAYKLSDSKGTVIEDKDLFTVWGGQSQGEDYFMLECNKSGSFTNALRPNSLVKVNGKWYFLSMCGEGDPHYFSDDPHLIEIDKVEKLFQIGNNWYYINSTDELVGPRNELERCDDIAQGR